MKNITPAELVNLVEALARTFEEEESSLNELDSKVGDGECGTNLRKAFRTASVRLQSQLPRDVGSVIERLGMHFITSAGGTIGILFGVGIHAAGKEAAGISCLGATDVVKMGNAAIEAVKVRGKAQTGDKTFLDALIPAVAAFSASVDKGTSIDNALNDAVSSARKGAEATKSMVAHRGRASYLGGRSLGHIDPGARAFVLALESARKFLTGR